MARAKIHGGHKQHHEAGAPSDGTENEEDVGLLAHRLDEDDEEEDDDDDDDDIVVHPGKANAHAAEPRTPRTPRTPNRVRFDLTPSVVEPPSTERDGASRHGNWRTSSFDIEDPESPRSQHRLPLLTDIEAPSVTLANSPWGDEDVHSWAEEERRRPKSGLRSAFMNMANSIIGAGIIGQPYAFRQAGLLAGVILLVGLTAVVDWTIRLIVINSKLSGSNSFQGTVEHCFGRTGLIAISIAQWAFAFGGMVAFGVIVGDSIPHVLTAVWPSLREVPVLGLLANRRVVIVIFILGVSYPLTLYRDIAKVSWFDGERQRSSKLLFVY
jgi:solute carrier family 38 (sodium-coupled neutral amino acid transporter), member 11